MINIKNMLLHTYDHLKITILFSLLAPIYAYCQQSPNMFVVGQLRDSVYNLQQASSQALTQANGTKAILEEINNIEKKIKTLEEKTGLSSAQSGIKTAQEALDQAMNMLYSKSINKKNENVFNKIYVIIKDMFEDPMIKEKTALILQLQQEMIQRIVVLPTSSDSWTKKIQGYGSQIRKLAQNQEKRVDPIISQATSLKSQLVSAFETNPNLLALDQKLTQKKYLLAKAVDELPSSVKIQIKDLENIIQKSNFLLQYLQDPRKPAQASPESIISQEIDPAFVSNP